MTFRSVDFADLGDGRIRKPTDQPCDLVFHWSKASTGEVTWRATLKWNKSGKTHHRDYEINPERMVALSGALIVDQEPMMPKEAHRRKAEKKNTGRSGRHRRR